MSIGNYILYGRNRLRNYLESIDIFIGGTKMKVNNTEKLTAILTNIRNDIRDLKTKQYEQSSAVASIANRLDDLEEKVTKMDIDTYNNMMDIQNGSNKYSPAYELDIDRIRYYANAIFDNYAMREFTDVYVKDVEKCIDSLPHIYNLYATQKYDAENDRKIGIVFNDTWYNDNIDSTPELWITLNDGDTSLGFRVRYSDSMFNSDVIIDALSDNNDEPVIHTTYVPRLRRIEHLEQTENGNFTTVTSVTNMVDDALILYYILVNTINETFDCGDLFKCNVVMRTVVMVYIIMLLACFDGETDDIDRTRERER